MTKPDMLTTISAADALLETLTDPRHRRIIANYRRHAIFEVCGEWEGIFTPDMTVERPVYYFQIQGANGVKLEGDEVKQFYRGTAEAARAVILVEDEQLMVADWGFTSDSIMKTYQRGEDLAALGLEVDDPRGFYVLKQRLAMIWHYDEWGRLEGEHVFENMLFQDVIKIPEEAFVTVADARARLMPELRPLPAYEPADPTPAGAAAFSG